jgi:hypothetical protein
MRQDTLVIVAATFAVTLIRSFIAMMKTGFPTATTAPGWMTLFAQYSSKEVVTETTTTT